MALRASEALSGCSRTVPALCVHPGHALSHRDEILRSSAREIEMVDRCRAVAGKVEAKDGEYVPFEACAQLLSEHRDFHEVAISLVRRVAAGETTTDEAHQTRAVTRRLEGCRSKGARDDTRRRGEPYLMHLQPIRGQRVHFICVGSGAYGTTFLAAEAMARSRLPAKG